MELNCLYQCHAINRLIVIKLTILIPCQKIIHDNAKFYDIKESRKPNEGMSCQLLMLDML